MAKTHIMPDGTRMVGATHAEGKKILRAKAAKKLRKPINKKITTKY